MNGHASGIAALSQNFRPLTRTAPITAPPSRPSPPIATQTAISMDRSGASTRGLMMPTCGTYRMPASAAIMAERHQIPSFSRVVL